MEFFSDSDRIDMTRLSDIGVVIQPCDGVHRPRLERFLREVAALRSKGRWTKMDLVTAIQQACPDLTHLDSARFLDEKM